jgi:hypothetical protein
MPKEVKTLSALTAWSTFAVCLNARAADDAHVEALGTVGFTEHITADVQAYGFGTGLRAGYTFSAPFALAGGLTRHAGARASAAGPGAIYSSRSSAWSVDVFAAWDWRPGLPSVCDVHPCVSLRFGLVFNAALIFQRTQVRGALTEDTYVQGSLGPKLALAVFPTRGFMLGLEGEARAIPTRFFAPLGSVAVFWGARF